jgi:hypothetical protein
MIRVAYHDGLTNPSETKVYKDDKSEFPSLIENIIKRRKFKETMLTVSVRVPGKVHGIRTKYWRGVYSISTMDILSMSPSALKSFRKELGTLLFIDRPWEKEKKEDK